MNQDDDDPKELKNSKKDKKSKEIRRSKSFDIRNMFRTKNQPQNELTPNPFASPPPLNRNHSQPESTKLNTLRKTILDRTQSMKKTTADFFGVNKDHEDEKYQLWLEKRKRFYIKSGSKIKEKSPFTSGDTNDSQHVSLFVSGDLEATPNLDNLGDLGFISAYSLPKPSVMKLAFKGIKSLQQEKTKKTNLVADEQHSPAICMSVIRSAEPQEVSLKQFTFDDTTEDQTESSRIQEKLDAQEFLPNELIFNYELPKIPTKTWTIVDRRGRQRINSKVCINTVH